MSLEPRTSPFNIIPRGQAVTNWTSGQLVTACHVWELLKGEVIGSRRTNNLIMELVKIHKEGVGVGALQRCELGSTRRVVHETGCQIKDRLKW